MTNILDGSVALSKMGVVGMEHSQFEIKVLMLDGSLSLQPGCSVSGGRSDSIAFQSGISSLRFPPTPIVCYNGTFILRSLISQVVIAAVLCIFLRRAISRTIAWRCAIDFELVLCFMLCALNRLWFVFCRSG